MCDSLVRWIKGLWWVLKPHPSATRAARNSPSGAARFTDVGFVARNLTRSPTSTVCTGDCRKICAARSADEKTT
jgi:hypothetical protein